MSYAYAQTAFNAALVPCTDVAFSMASTAAWLSPFFAEGTTVVEHTLAERTLVLSIIVLIIIGLILG